MLLRLKEDYDGAEPAASSVSVRNLLTLAHLTGDPTMAEKIERTLAAFGGRVAQMGRAVPMMLAALSTYHAGMPQLVIVGDAAGARPFLDAVRGRYLPTTLVVHLDEKQRAAFSRLLPWTASMGMKDGRATAYLCRDFACVARVTTPVALRERIPVSAG